MSDSLPDKNPIYNIVQISDTQCARRRDNIIPFSKLSEVSRKALIFYDNTGLFSPEYTGENGYRYYSHEQIYTISVINTLKELGMPLNKIKTYMQTPSPSKAIWLLEN